MNIVVLCGGLYPERDVSIVSGGQIAAALIENGHRVLLMDVFFGLENMPEDINLAFDNCLDRLSPQLGNRAPDLAQIAASRPGAHAGPLGPNVLPLCKAADIVFMALHGEDGENGKIQAVFDLHEIFYTGSGYLGSALAMNKGISRVLFERGGIRVAPGQVVSAGGHPAPDLTVPCVVKPCSGGSSVATTVVEDIADLGQALGQVFAIDKEALIEGFIPGREFSVGVLGKQVLPVIEICPREGFYNYENKYQKGFAHEICPAELSPEQTKEMQAIAQRAHEILGLDVYSRTDLILANTGEIYCLETNTLPGMTPLSLLPQEARAAGFSFGDLCEEILKLSLEKYA